ncbi:MAG: von Willebrand factor type A domain-containing protein [Polyangiaceae bacterium]|nr:von Willebrand factor type A domain-containing protein [Polyangiaceae bacterium]
MRAWHISIVTVAAWSICSVACSEFQDDAASAPNDGGDHGPDHPDPTAETYAYGTGGTSAGTANSPSLTLAVGEEDGDEPAPAGDRYESVGTNPFVITASDPLSTFGADVDTASYDLFRRDMMDGLLPDPTSVRLEEYVNYFDYGYEAPAADADHPFSLDLAAAPGLFDHDTVMLRVGIQAVLPPEDGEKRPANLVFLVDTSGSMTSADKLPLVQYTLTQTLEVLDPTDTVAIVTYAGSTAVRLPPTPVAGSETILDVIHSLASGGSTAGAAGLDLAYAQAQAGFIEGGINHVILCTDGDFNVGPSSTAELVAMIEEERRTGVTLTVLGFGSGNLNDAMMEAISNKGNGVYGVMTDEVSVANYVAERMLSTMNFVAKDMKIQVELNPALVYAYRLLGYENRAIADDEFRDDTVDAGEIGAGHSVTALYELVLTGHEIPSADGAPEPIDGAVYTDAVEVAPEDLVMVKIRYKDVDATETDPAYEVAEALAPKAVGTSEAELDVSFQWATAVASFAEILKGSPYADPERLSTVARVVARPAFDGDPDKEEFESLFVSAVEMMAEP